MFPIGVQVYSVRDHAEKDFRATLAKIKEFGYDGVEFAGLYGIDAKTVKGWLDELGLVAVSAHVALDEMLADPDKCFSDYKTLGCRYIAVPYLDTDRRPGHERFEETLADIRKMAEKSKEYGIQMMYHNHDFEFVKIGDKYGYDIIFDSVPADLLKTEQDTCWVNVAGEDPASYLVKYTGRAPVVHIKDFVMKNRNDLQIGVGGIPNAVINALRNHQHLGLHTEAITDGVLPLIEKGIIDNSQKKILPGKSVGSLVLGSKHLYDYIDGNRNFVIRDVAWTNDPQIIRQNPRAMAINSAIEVDLTGQICADSIGETIISGVGGQHDFMYGAALSEGGKCFIALPSMTKKGQSKIVAHLAPGAGVVTTRFQAQYIVTEHGIAFLRNLPLADRAKALIRIADPSVREDLERAAVARFGIGFLRLR